MNSEEYTIIPSPLLVSLLKVLELNAEGCSREGCVSKIQPKPNMSTIHRLLSRLMAYACVERFDKMIGIQGRNPRIYKLNERGKKYIEYLKEIHQYGEA